MTARLVMTILDRPCSPAELDAGADLIAGGYLDGAGNSKHTKGTLWERAAERTPSGKLRARRGALILPRLEDERGPTALSSPFASGVIRPMGEAA